MKKTVEFLKKQFNTNQGEHSRFRNLYEDVFRYGMPGRYNNITDTDTTGQKNREVIFSSVFEEACDEFVQRFQSLVCPVNSNWIDFEAGYMFQKDSSNTDDANKELAKIANILNVFKSTSNFDTTFTEASYDLIAGTACICALEGTPDNPFNFSAIPFVDIIMAEGIDGSIDTYFRKIKMRNSLIKVQWPDINYTYDDGKDDEEVELLEATYYDYDTKLWNYSIIHKDKFLLERSYKCSPFIDLRWAKCAGETYGRGPGLKVIADVKTLNRIKQYSLQALSFTIPTFTCSIDEGFEPEKFVLEPGAMNPVPSNMTNNPTVRQLEVNPMPELGNYNMEQLEMNIKKGMFASTIPNDPARMTATEINRRISELDNSLNNSFGRLLEFLYRLIRRMIEIAQRFGYLSNDLDVMAFNGFGYKVKVNTQLANQQTQKEVVDILNSVQVLAQFDPNMQMLTKCVKIQELLPYVLDRMGVPNQFLRTAEEISQLEQQEAEAMAMQQQAMAMQDVEVANAKEQGKADAQRQYKS